jgi:tetratricopeptide (TPR) repeat protein
MAEGIVEGLLGAEEEFEGDESQVEAIADPVAVAVAMDAAKYDPELAHKAGEYLDRQRELVVHTLKHFDEERHLQVQAAKRKRISDILKISLQVVLAFIGIALAVGFGDLVLSAIRSRSVVVEEFKAPPSLAPMGLSGEVVATGVLDELQRLQNATRGVGTLLTAKSAWTSDVKIEVPETGVSIGEINRLLHERFSHDLHISGDLVQTPDGGLILSVRGDDVPPKSFEGAGKELEKITDEAAEYIYGRSQPYQLLNYYIAVKRDEDAVKIAQEAMTWDIGDPLRAQLFNGWGNALMDLDRPTEAAEKYRLAIGVQPLYWQPRGNLLNSLVSTEGEEAAYQESKRYITAVAGAKPSDRPRPAYLSQAANSLVDTPMLLAGAQDDYTRNRGAGATNQSATSGLASATMLIHDSSQATRWLLQSDPKDAATELLKHQVPLTIATYAGEPGSQPLSLEDATKGWAVWQSRTDLQSGDDTPCVFAFAFGMNGDTADSEKAFKVRDNYVRCYALRGVLLEHQGKLPDAEAKWAAGISKAPDLPWVYMARGQSRMRRGDLARAIADFSAANHGAPHFADPLKFWGDALVKQGKSKEAIAKYDEALTYAPKWTELVQARAAVAH